MEKQNEQNKCPHCNVALATGTKPFTPLSPAQTQLLEFINALDAPDLVQSLKLVHNLALYHSDISINEEEKVALCWAKGLWEHIHAVSMEN
ncbi:hypothetical protein [Flagellimonas flava]|uniref:hypothetical protein n=1 Tax=Flagellimonas flava TaxID=570519 RepID=UPI003D6474AC